MALQRTPPNKFSSESNIPDSVDHETCNIRKRKQPEDEELLSERLNKQSLTWEAAISNTVSAAVSSAMSNELGKITYALTEINANIVKLNTENVKINTILAATNDRLNDFEKSINYSSERQDLFDSRLKKMEDEASHTMDTRNQITALENKIGYMEQQARQCNIEISNLPERRGENLINMLALLGDTIKVPVRSSDIIAVHRVPHANQKDPRPRNIVVKFTTRTQRDNVITACRAAKGVTSAMLSITGTASLIYVNEHLTLSNKILFRQCRETAKEKQYLHAWVKHGTILVRKTDTSPVIAIRSAQDVAKIK